MKKILSTALVALMGATFFIGGGGASATTNVQVQVDGKAVTFPDAQPFVDSSNGRTMVPVRFVSEALDSNVGWDQATKTVLLNFKGEKTITLKVGEKKASVGGKTVTFDASAQLRDNRTYVPLRFISESFGAKVDWQADKRLVVISTGATAVTTPTGNTTAGGFTVVAVEDPSMLGPKDPVTEPLVQAFVDSLRFNNGVVTGKVPTIPAGHTINFNYVDASDGKWGVRSNDKNFDQLKAGESFSVKIAGKGGNLSFGFYKGAEGKAGVSVAVPQMTVKWTTKR